MTRARALRVTRETEGNFNECPTVAFGVQLPSGTVIVEWVPEAFPEGERTRYHSQSIYGSLADAKQATGGTIVFEDDRDEANPGNQLTSPRDWDWDWESATISRARREDRAPHLGEYVSWTSPRGTEMEACVCGTEVRNGDIYIITEDDDAAPVEWLDGYGDDGGDENQ